MVDEIKKENFVTLFDSLYLPQAIALHNSMQKHIKDYLLWMLCVDEISYLTLSHLKLPNTMLLNLSEIETDELKEVKRKRTPGEYCWTLTPFAPDFVFERDQSIQRVTYIDADIWFRKSPDIIFDEFSSSDKAVMITDHGYAPEFDHNVTAGQYCVQFMIFKKYESEHIRKHWQHSCLDWCFARHENGKFGDQKYLDDWGSLFPNQIHILSNRELTLAPWNATRFPFGNSIFYHFHGLKIINEVKIFVGNYPIPLKLKENVYKNYLIDLKAAINLLKRAGFKVLSQKPPLRYIQILRRVFSTLYSKFSFYFDSGIMRF
jgi:hypothetical protein